MSGAKISEPPLIALVGPTAVGKTAAGVALAKQLGGEIISADAVAVYQGLDIGAAKPTQAEREGIPFHLIDVVRPDEEFTVAEFSRLADETISAIRQRGNVPIIVGGTGLYVRSVTAVLSMPNVPPHPEIRASLWSEVEEQGALFLYERLQKVDPLSAEKILPGDAKRVIRALEVFEVTGQPMSAFHTPEGVHGIPRKNTHLFGLNMARERLYQRIEMRVDAMIAMGFVDEVRMLLDKGYASELRAMQSLGYRHICAYLKNDLDFVTAITELKRDTRRYAKRQMIWFNADPNIRWLDMDKSVPSLNREGMENLAEIIVDTLHQRKS